MKTLLTTAAMVLAAGMSMAEPVKVAVVNGPLASFVETLGGDGVEVIFPAPTDGDPAFWSPTADDIAQYQSADVILLNGAGYAGWVKNASLPRAKLTDTSKAFKGQLIEIEGDLTHSHGGEGEHSHTGVARTTWLDLQFAAMQVEATSLALEPLLDPEDLAAATRVLIQELILLDTDFAELAAKISGPVIASHPRYEYFTRAYGLDSIGLHWEADEVPTPAQVADLKARIAGTNTRIFLWEAEPIPEAAKAVSDLGLVGVIFDPGDHLTDGQSFQELMRENYSRLEAGIAAS